MVNKKRSSRLPTRPSGVLRYNRILEAAGRLVEDSQSLDLLTLKAVADEAGIPRVSLYYFFDSADALIDALYQRGVEKMMTSVSDLSEPADWRELIETVLDKSREFYEQHSIERVLALSPKSLPALVQANKVIGRELHTLMVARARVSKSAKVGKACEIAAEIADAIWRKSFIELGDISHLYHQQTKLAVVGYLEAVIGHDDP